MNLYRCFGNVDLKSVTPLVPLKTNPTPIAHLEKIYCTYRIPLIKNIYSTATTKRNSPLSTVNSKDTKGKGGSCGFKIDLDKYSKFIGTFRSE